MVIKYILKSTTAYPKHRIMNPGRVIPSRDKEGTHQGCYISIDFIAIKPALREKAPWQEGLHQDLNERWFCQRCHFQIICHKHKYIYQVKGKRPW